MFMTMAMAYSDVSGSLAVCEAVSWGREPQFESVPRSWIERSNMLGRGPGMMANEQYHTHVVWYRR